jgi:hypothetical protein
MEGWIRVYRKIQDNPYYFSESFTRSQAWLDMLIIANYKEGFFFKRGVKVVVNRAQIGWDVETLAKRWKWSRGKVERFFLDLEMQGQIIRQKTNVTTLISIVNYEQYQGDDNADSEPSRKADGHQTVKQTDTNKKNKKKKKKENADFVSPEINEVVNYFIEKGFSKELAIRAFNFYAEANWKDSRGNQVLNWKQKMNSVWFKPENKTFINSGKMQKSNAPGGGIV